MTTTELTATDAAAEGSAIRAAKMLVASELTLTSAMPNDVQHALLEFRLAQLAALGGLRPEEKDHLLGLATGHESVGTEPDASVVARTIAFAVAVSAGPDFSGAGPVTTVLAAAGGALIGFALGGPVGAEVGAVAGTVAAQEGW